jgi:hypothetical protein
MPRPRLSMSSMSASISAHKHKIAVTAASCTAVTGAVVGALTATAQDAQAATLPVAQQTVSSSALTHAQAHALAVDDAPAHPSGKALFVKPAAAPPKKAAPAPAPAKPAPAPAPATTEAAPPTQAPPPAAPVVSSQYSGLSAYQIAQRVVPSGQFGCFDWIVSRESGWDVTATNPSSGAYGLGQALPGYKMASAGPDWQTDALTQIKWTLGYMDERYGSPCGAEAFWQGHGWY